MRAGKEPIFAVKKSHFPHWFLRRMGQKNTLFEKQNGEVGENKGSGLKNEPERTGKRSGEVVENTYLWKKRTENEPGHVIENKDGLKTSLRTKAI